MSHTLHVFNPSHDEALAAHSPHYSPSAAARLLACNLAELPRIWANPDDECLLLPPSGSVQQAVRPNWEAVERIAPWGWDLHIVDVLRRLGAPERLLPTSEQLELWRGLSSRVNVSEVQALDTEGWLTHQAGMVPFRSIFCRNMEEVQQAWDALGREAMVKSPWSSSGRGVFPLREAWNDCAASRIRKILSKQGGIELQSLHEVRGNFALEYEALADGTVRYVGLSLFQAATGGAYLGNYVAHPSHLEQRLLHDLRAGASDCLLSAVQWQTTLAQLQQHLAHLLECWLRGRYIGPLGIDMLITPSGIHPCVEINLRRTMGHVAVHLSRQQSLDAPLQVLRITLEGWHLVAAETGNFPTA